LKLNLFIGGLHRIPHLWRDN